MQHIWFYVPESHAEAVKRALFNAGAGRLGDYEQCCWQTKGQGQFKPLSGAQPFVGEQDKLEIVSELKVEMICDDEYVLAACAALKASHPYEQPAFGVTQCQTPTTI